VSRTAAHTSARASASSHPNRSAHADGGGPTQRTSASASRGSTRPPGNTYMPAAKAIVRRRRRKYASTPSGPSRSSTTVAASTGCTGSASRLATSSRSDAGRGTRTAYLPGLGDQLDLDGNVQRQRGHTDGAAG